MHILMAKAIYKMTHRGKQKKHLRIIPTLYLNSDVSQENVKQSPPGLNVNFFLSSWGSKIGPEIGSFRVWLWPSFNCDVASYRDTSLSEGIVTVF